MVTSTDRPEVEVAERRREDWRSFLWHLAFFVLVNAFIVAQDLLATEGLDWALWVLIPWGIGLIVHLAMLLLTGRRIDETTNDLT